MTLDVAWAIDWVRRSAQTVTEHRYELIELDRQIGDGDHGENLFRGFTAVVAKLDALEEQPADIGEVLKLVATTLMSTVGGAAGPLYGTAYLRAAKATGVAELDSHGVVALLEAALEGIVARGKAHHRREDDGRRLDARGRGRRRRRRRGRRRRPRCSRPRRDGRARGRRGDHPADRDEGPRELPGRAVGRTTWTRARARPS